LYLATSPYRGHGSISAARAIFKSNLFRGRMIGGRFLRFLPVCQAGTADYSFDTNEQIKNDGSPDYNSQPGVQRGHIRFASSDRQLVCIGSAC
jgi:hypothetical protein